MDKANNANKIPHIVDEAYKLLLQYRIVSITEPLHEIQPTDRTGWSFECAVKVPHPNNERPPHKVSLRVLIPETFPREPVEVFSLTDEVCGFPHQDAESRKLCLREETLAPLNASRLVCYVKWAIEWLKDAANGTLLKPGEPYELPDFSRKLLAEPLPTPLPVIFEESPNSYKIWKSRIGTSGYVECVWPAAIPALFSFRYSDGNQRLIRESKIFESGSGTSARVNARWIILPDIRYQRHRPPQTYQELETLCSRANVEFYLILEDAWKARNPCNLGIFLVGFPITELVGEPPTEIHWQPLLFPNLGGFRAQKAKNSGKGSLRKPKQIWRYLREEGCFSPSQQLPWGKVENIARERLYKRGSYSFRVQSTSIACIGCGALGSFCR